MSSNNVFRSDLFDIHSIIQASMLVYPKEVFIAVLRDFFSRDSFYHYVRDEWGFAKTTDHTDLPLDAGLHNNLTTRVFIGENYRYDGIYYPAILVKSGGTRYVPISINRNQDTVQYENILFEDGYGNETIVSRPKTFVTAGAWEGSIVVDIMTRSLRSRDDLAELVGMCFTEVVFDTLYDIGIIVKPGNLSAPTETDDRNDKLFKVSWNFDIRTEWRREVPVGDLIDAILFVVEFADLEKKHPVVAQNLTIRTEVDLAGSLPGT